MPLNDAKPAKELHTLLVTKVQAPRARADLIDRPRLTRLAAKAADMRLTIIKAPAGFGKTSLARAWIEPLRSAGARVAWLALDIDDDEPGRFFYQLASALHTACEGVGESTMSLAAEASLVPVGAFVPMLINGLVDIDEEVCLFIDDYHVIADPAIHAAMSSFVENVSSQMHVVICTRAELALPVGRLRASNDVLEIDAAMLRFDLAETQAFVERACPALLETLSVKRLHAGTEGWAAALRISATTLAREAADTVGRQTLLTGASRPMSAYLEALLAHLPADTVLFMMRAAIVDELNAPLCAAISGCVEAQRMLESIAAQQVLLEPIDHEGRFFRFHRLMAEYLVQRLDVDRPGEAAQLHRLASKWYAANERWTDAVKHALLAGATEEAISLMGHCAKALVAKGDLLTLLGWQRQFPSELMQEQPRVSLAIAWGLALAMRFADAHLTLEAIETGLHDRSQTEMTRIRWECDAIRAVIAALEDKPLRALEIAQRCLAASTHEVWATNVLSNVIRLAHWKAGDLDALHATPWIPYSGEGDRRHMFNAVYRVCLLGHVEMQQMHFALAQRHFTNAMTLAAQGAGPHSISAALCVPMIGHIRYEQNDIDGAEAIVIDHMPVIERAVLLDSVLFAYRMLVRIAFLRHHLPHAYALLDRAQAIGHSRKWSRLVAGALVERTRLYLAEARIVEAAGCVSQLDTLARASADAESEVSYETQTYRALGTAYLALARNQTAPAIAVLREALSDVERRNNDYLALRLNIVLALASFEGGQRDHAIERFSELLSFAQASGIYRSIVDQGPTLVPLLQACRNVVRDGAQTPDGLAYVDRLLGALRSGGDVADDAMRAPVREALSTRERRIVALIAQGQSNKEIARTLGIGPETVKSHVKSIFVKLDVDKRAHAVVRAQALGLVVDA